MDTQGYRKNRMQLGFKNISQLWGRSACRRTVELQPCTAQVLDTLPGLLLRTPDCSTGSCLWEEFIPPSPYTHRVSKTILFFFFFFLTFFLWFSQGSRSSPISRTQVRLCMGLHLAKHTPTYLLTPLPVSQTALSYLALS